MKIHVSHSILLAIVMGSCSSDPRTNQQRIEPELDLNLRSICVGGFALQMTPRAALAVIQAKHYRESYGNLVTIEDLALNPRSDFAIADVFEFSNGETLDDRLLRETGTFSLEFERGRVLGITYDLKNLTKDKLKEIRERNEETFHFVTDRETNGPTISWKYSPNKLAYLRINYMDHEPLFAVPQVGDAGVGQCDYSITMRDANPYIVR
jgi:hypothetical protein